MSGLIGSKPSAAAPNLLSGMTIQTSSYGLPIPILYGKTRICGNLIWYSNFQAIQSGSQGGGKGGGGGGGSATYNYYAALMFSLCEGPISGISQCWATKTKDTPGNTGFSDVFAGNYPETTWGFLTTNYPAKAVAYNGTARIASAAFPLGTSGQIPNLTYETSKMSYSPAGDARVDLVITDFLTSVHYGVPSFNSSRLGDLSLLQAATVANDIFISPYLDAQTPAIAWLSDWARIANCGMVWSEGKLKFIPFWDSAATGTAFPLVSFTPDLTPQYDLTDEDFLHDKGNSVGPVECDRKSPADAFNSIELEYLNRARDYNVEVIKVKDQSSIEQHGLLVAPIIKMHAITEAKVAQATAQRELQRALYIRNLYTFKLGPQYGKLEAMDIVTITDSVLGLNRQLVRILDITDEVDFSRIVTAEEMLVGTASPAKFRTETPAGYVVNYNEAPGNANSPVIFEPPLALSGTPQMWLATSGGASWGGAEVWVSTDNATYKKVGVVCESRHGVSSASLPFGTDPDVTNALAVDLSISSGQLSSGTLADRDLYNTLCYIGGELVSYQTATLTGANTYSLTSLRRGAYGSAITVHSSGSAFARLDNNVLKYAYDPLMVGQPLYVKLRSFNKYGSAAQDLAAITPFTYAIAGAPVGTISGLALVQAWTGTACAIKWTPYPGATSYKVEIWIGASKVRTTANVTTSSFLYSFEDNKADGGPHRNVEFRVYAVNSTGQSSSPAVLSVTNSQIAAPAGLSTMVAGSAIELAATMPTATDYAGTMVFVSTTSGVDPSTLTPVYDGPANFFTIPDLTSGVTYYFHMVHYDIFGKDALNYSSEVSAVASASGGIPTVANASTLTTLANPSYWAVYDLTTKKIWRWNAATNLYTSAADGADIVANTIAANALAVSDLSAITANLGTITAGNITLDYTGYIRGGASSYASGNGFWMGYNGATYKFSMGNSSTGNMFTWDGTNLSIGLGGTTLGISSATQRLSVNDGTRDRVLIGNLGGGAYGIRCYDTSGNLFLDTGGVTGLGSFAYLNSLSPSNIGTYMSNLSVDTLQIANQAVTVPVVVARETSITYNLTQGQSADIISASTVASGAPISMTLSIAPGSIPSSGAWYFKLTRNGTILRDLIARVSIDGSGFATAIPVIILFSDIPPAGTTVYKLTLYNWTNAPGDYTNYTVAHSYAMFLETKK